MAHIPQLDYADAGPEQQAAHDEELRLRGRMTNMKRTLMHSPAALRVYGEWFTLAAELRPLLGDRAIWLFCLAISQATQSQVGIGFMRRALIQSGNDPDGLVLSADEALLQRFGTALAAGPKTVPADIWQDLSARYAERTMVDLVAFAGIMIATNVFTDAVKTELDAELLPFMPG